jgi:3-(3-hydroxy-phenyl)propionate hydroxylase
MFDFTVTGAEVQALSFAYQRSPEQSAAAPTRHPVVVVGAGPVGLSLAIDLAQRGQRVLLLDNDHCLSSGSRAICFAKRTLEIWDRLGVGQAAVNKGVSWETGRVFFQDAPIYAFNLQTEPGHERPAFVNLQQYYAEAYLLKRALELPLIEIRWHNSVTVVTQTESFASLTVNTPDGDYSLEAQYLVACDGGRSAVRKSLGLESKGRSFNDRFLIADVVFETGSAESVFPPERWFWFDPPFHPGQSVLLHRQPDGVWRIDFQLGWEADPALEQTEAKIRPRVDAMMQAALGRTVPFQIEWASVYSFVCLRMPSFVHGRVFFAGDSAHGVSPFGARGANSGVQDADNLAWKLAAVLSGQAPTSLLASYGEEREFAADVNIAHSTRATDFITPKARLASSSVMPR